MNEQDHPDNHHNHPDYPKITKEQHAILAMMTTQRCANWAEAMDFIADMPTKTKDMLLSTKPETIEWLRDLRPDEIAGLKAYLVLRSTGSYLAWGVGILFGAIVAGSTLYNMLSGWFKK